MSDQAKNPLVFVVDNDPASRDSLVESLQSTYEVRALESGADLLMLLECELPELILLDVELPGLNGYETCRRIRERRDLPIVFIAAHPCAESHRLAFEAGGDDFIVKPGGLGVLVHVIERCLRVARQAEVLAVERDAMRQMAVDLLNVNEHNRMLIEFLDRNIGGMHYEDLCRDFADVLDRLNIVGALEFRLPVEVPRTLFGDCRLTALEEDLLSRPVGESSCFRYKERYIVKGPHIALLVLNSPQDEMAAAHLHRLLKRLESLGESLIASIAARIDAPRVIENLQVASLGAHTAIRELSEDYRQQQLNSAALLQGLIDKIEASYYFLGLTAQQEAFISSLLHQETNAVQALFQSGMMQLEGRLEGIMNMLAPPQPTACDVWL